jgi:hypothetical protein
MRNAGEYGGVLKACALEVRSGHSILFFEESLQPLWRAFIWAAKKEVSSERADIKQ